MSSKPPEADIEGDECYHGDIEEEDIQDMLESYGDYLIRSEVSATKPTAYLLCVYNALEIKEFQIMIEGTKISIQGCKEKYDNVTDLIKDLVGKKTKLSDCDHELVRAVKRLPWELSKSQVDVSEDKPLGFGQAYVVRKGIMTFNGEKTPVALKVMGRKDLQYPLVALKDAHFMRTIDHPNCIRFYGIVMKEPVMLVTELVNMGDLLSYLRKENEPKMTPLEKARLAVQAAWAVEYLHSKKITHRRITARKCLLNRAEESGDKIQLKLGEMDVEDPVISHYSETRKAMKSLPMRHMAPECITHGLYNTKTDVWMFGCLLFEIYSGGKPLYCNLNLTQLHGHFYSGNSGNPQEIPTDFPNHAKELIQAAWDKDPRFRPEMERIAHALEKYTKTTAPTFVVRKKVNETKNPEAEVLAKKKRILGRMRNNQKQMDEMNTKRMVNAIRLEHRFAKKMPKKKFTSNRAIRRKSGKF